MSGEEQTNEGTATIAANGRVDRNVRCRHGQLSIVETGTWETAHYREKDGTWWHNNEPGDYFEKVLVKCRGCGFEREYNRHRVPKWLRTALDELGI